jgi:flagella basal body P-ring formation protein FlgA
MLLARRLALILAAVVAVVPGWVIGKPGVAAIEDAPVTIKLFERVDIRSEQVTLGDVAHITTRDLATLRLLLALSLGRTPRGGEVTSVSRARLQDWVRRSTRLNAADIDWAGADEVVIRQPLQTITSEQLNSVAREALSTWLSTKVRHSQINVAHAPPAIDVPEGNVRLQARPLPAGLSPATRMAVWVEVWSANRFLRVVPVTFQVTAQRDAWVARRDLNAGELLSSEMLERREIDVTLQPSVALEMVVDQTDKLPSGRRLRRSLRAGQALDAASAETVPAVNRGDWALLRLYTGTVVVEARVEVMQDGRPGQTVRVRMPSASGSVLAKVAAPGILEMTQ